MAGVRRFLRRLASVAGFAVNRIGPGAVLVTRKGDGVSTRGRGKYRALPLGPGAWIVTRGKPRRRLESVLDTGPDDHPAVRVAKLAGLAVLPVAPGAVLLAAKEAGEDGSPRSTYRVIPVGSTSSLVAERHASRELEPEVDWAITEQRVIELATAAGFEAETIAPGAVLLSVKESGPDGSVRSKYKVIPVRAMSGIVTPREVTRAIEYERQRMTEIWAGQEHLWWVLRKYEVNCVLDVGANKGQFAGSLRKMGYSGHIVSFEPVPEIFEDLERASRRDPRWTAHQIALGRESGELEMHVVPGGCSSVLAASDFGRRRFQQLANATPAKVPVRRLDAIVRDILPPDLETPRIFLKLDTQGFDLEVFAGTGEVASSVVVLQSEVALLPIYEGMPLMRAALDTYEAAGFEITAMYPVSYDHPTMRVLEYDCIMVRPSAVPAVTA